jgi:hypothetical protein
VLTFDPHRSVVHGALAVEPIAIEALALLRPGLPPSIKVTPPAAGSAGLIKGDATEVHQVIMNLCTNAVRAMPRGGELTVQVATVQVDALRDLTLGRLQPGCWLHLSIKDTGIGLAPEQLQSIFDPFYTSRAVGEEGSGIGLTVVRNIVSSMGGAIEVQSSPGSGTTMSVYWPLLQPAAACASAQTGYTANWRRSGDPHCRRRAGARPLAEEIVASLGYEAIGFSDPTTAIESFRRAPARFDAVLTDERMPDSSRHDARGNDSRTARRHSRSCSCTGIASAQTDARALALPASSRSLAKPLRAWRVAGSARPARSRGRPLTVATEIPARAPAETPCAIAPPRPSLEAVCNTGVSSHDLENFSFSVCARRAGLSKAQRRPATTTKAQSA